MFYKAATLKISNDSRGNPRLSEVTGLPSANIKLTRHGNLYLAANFSEFLNSCFVEDNYWTTIFGNE